MKTIWKFQIPITDEFELTMPEGAKPLCVQWQGISPQIWAFVDPEQPQISRRFFLRGTGHPCDGLENKTYLGTFQMRGGQLIFHLFYEP